MRKLSKPISSAIQKGIAISCIACLISALVGLSFSIAKAQPFAYVPNFGEHTVSVIDTATTTEVDVDGNPGNGITRIPVGDFPQGIAVTPDGAFVYVTSQGNSTVSVIDTATNTELDVDGNPGNGITRIPVGGQPYGVAVTPDGAFVYVANLGNNTVSVIDTSTKTVTHTVLVGSFPFAFGQFIGPVIDTSAPNTTITASPPALSNSTSASFSFTSDEAGSSFECSLDSGAFTACASPKSYINLSEGNHSFQVRGKDAANNVDATPATFSWTIDISPPETTITSAPANPTNNTGASFSFTSTEANSTFQCNLDSAGFSACVNPQDYTGLATGGHTFQVRAVDPAGNFDTTPASYTWTITTVAAGTTTTLTSSLNPSTWGQSVTFTATVTAAAGTPTGTVTFMDGAVAIGSAALNSSGQASFSTAALSVGTHSITGVYGGSASFGSSTSAAITQTVNRAASTTTLASSANPSALEQIVTFTASISGAGGVPTGTVTFLDGNTSVGTGTLNASGQATFSTSSLATGSHNIKAVYGGDGTFLGSNSGTLKQTVQNITTTTTLSSSLNPSLVGQAVTFTAQVTSSSGGIPTGTVTFKDGGKTLGTATLSASGQASFSTSSLKKGSQKITAVYGGNATFPTSTSATLTQVVQ